MKLDQLYYLMEAVKFKSISIAARENFVPQSTVSTSISKLEKELEISLLKRSNKGISPTEEGQQIIEKSQQIFSLLNEIKAFSHKKAFKYFINIASMPSIVDTLLADVIIEVDQKSYPLSLNILTDEPHMIIKKVQLGSVHLGIILDDTPVHYTGLNSYPLFEDSYCLLVGKQSPFFERNTICISEALSIDHIAYKTEYEKETNILSRMIAPYGKPNIAVRVDNTETMRRILAKSPFGAFFPTFTIHQDAYIDSGKLRAIPISDASLKIYASCIESPNFKNLQGNQVILKVIHDVIQSNLK